MERAVYDINMDVLSEDLLFNPGLQKLQGNAEVSYFTRIGKLFKDPGVVFFEVVEKCRIHLLNLADGDLHDPEHGFDGVV